MFPTGILTFTAGGSPSWHTLIILLLVLVSSICEAAYTFPSTKQRTIVEVDLSLEKNDLLSLVDEGKFHQTISKLKEIKLKYGHLAVDPKMPSLFSVLVSLYRPNA